MRHASASRFRADVIAAWAVGSGIGLITLMLVWLVGNRLTELWLDAPFGPTVAFSAAVIAGCGTVALVGRHLAATVAAE